MTGNETQLVGANAKEFFNRAIYFACRLIAAHFVIDAELSFKKRGDAGVLELLFAGFLGIIGEREQPKSRAPQLVDCGRGAGERGRSAARRRPAR